MKIWRHLLTAGLVAGVTVASVPAAAALLGVQTGYPDIGFANSGADPACDYDSATSLLTITAQALSLTLVSGGVPDFITNGVVTIHATIDASGAFTGGDVTVTGMAGGYGSPMLTGTITQYGIDDFGTNDALDFVFTVTGGSLSGLYGSADGGVIVQTENATYEGTFGSDWGCAIAKGNIGPSIGTPPGGGGGGTGTIGYWKNHPDAWPVTNITIGGQVLTQAEAIDILKMAVKGNKIISMSKQLIAAKLNVAAGNDSSCIDDSIVAADAWIIAHGGVGAVQRQWDGGDLVHDELDAYNNGLLCAPHRAD